MKTRSRIACISAAVSALLYGGTLQARDLTFNEAVLTDDGQGGLYALWDTASANWFDGANPATWVNVPPDSAFLGNTTNAFNGATRTNQLVLSEAITVQDLTIGIAANGGTFNVYDFFGGSLTVAGNITKAAGSGNPQLFLDQGLTLTAGDHIIAANDTGGDAAPELRVNAIVKGAGNVIINNGASAPAWGTTSFNFDNTYTGTTTISKGRLVITTSGALGSTAAGTTIADAGTLSVGGSGQIVANPVNITEPLTITRNNYSGGDYGLYGSAITLANTGTNHTHTISGPLTIDSSDARIRVDTNTLVLPGGNIALGPNGGNGVLSFTGDFAGVVQLNGSNPALATNGILILGGVEVRPQSDAALGGPTAPITMRGGFFRPFAGMTTFGSHPINTTDMGVGISVPAGQSFTFDRVITAGTGGVLGKRGDGTLSIVSSVTGTGQTFWDAGVVNVNSALTIDNLHLRSPVVNIGTGGVVTLRAGFNSFGQDSNGTNGGPDKAVVNLTGNGQLIQTNGSEFNISDNPGTEGTINIYDNAVFTTGGITWLGKNNNTVGTINQFGGTININRTGNFGFVIADGRGAENPTGYFNLSGGTFNSAGEVYVGEGGSNAVGGTRAHGYWTQTGGTANINQWFVVGRESAVGHVDISGGILNHSVTGNLALGDSNAGGEVNTIKIRGTAVINNNTGGFWVGNNGSAVATAEVYDTAAINMFNGNFVVGRDGGTGTATLRGNSVTTVSTGELWVGQNGGKGVLNIQENATVRVQNNWLAVGRQGTGSTGTLNLSGGTLIKAGNGNIAVGSGGTGTFNQTGGTLTSNGTRVGEASNGTMNLTGGTATFTGGFSIGHNDNVVGTLNIGGTANVTVPAVVFGAEGAGTGGGALNLDGGTLTGESFTAGATSTGAKTFKFNGGQLVAAADSANFIDSKISSVVSTGGARINTNGRTVTVNSSMAHDATLADDDGGLLKSGAGRLILAGANTYTGATTVTAGTLQAVTPGSLPGYATAGKVTVASGATLAVNAGGAGEWSEAAITTVRSTSGFTAGSALGIDTSNAAAPFGYSPALAGAIGVTKFGGGTLVLGGANSYEGPTTVEGVGSLVLTSAAFYPVLTGPGGAVVNSGKLVFDYTGTTSPLTAVAGALDASHAASSFTDPSQRFRTTNPVSTDHGLGYLDDGASLLTVAYTWYGDANLDGTVNADDYALLDRGAAMGRTHWFNGDFNYDGSIGSADYLLTDTSFGKINGTLPAALLAERQAQFGDAYVAQLVAAVPEPGAAFMAGLGALGALARRRRMH